VIDDPSKRVEPLVLLRPGSEGPPLFLVHSIWGDVLGMRQMALAVETEVPVYGLRARGVSTDEEPQASVEEMARTYVGVIRAVQPEGPYRVAGHSYGALVAFEIARQLAQAGEEIDWLGMIDAELSTACLPRWRRWRYRAALPFHLVRAALRDRQGAAHSLFSRVIPNLLRRGVLRVFPRAPIAAPTPSWMEEAPLSYQHLAKACMEAAAAFRPRPYAGDMTYFLPQVRRLHLYADPLPVWKHVTKGGLTLERVPGPHVGMVSGMPGRFVAKRIDAHLAEANSTAG